MTKNFLIRKEFIERAKISEKVLKEWETFKIIKHWEEKGDQYLEKEKSKKRNFRGRRKKRREP